MSGPKYNQIALERQRQQELERQRKIEQARQKRIKTAKNTIQQNNENLTKNINNKQNKLKEFKNLISEYDISVTQSFTNLKNKVDTINTAVQEVLSKKLNSHENELANIIEQQQSILQKLNLLDSNFDNTRMDIKNIYSEKLLNEITELSAKINKAHEQKLKEDNRKLQAQILEEQKKSIIKAEELKQQKIKEAEAKRDFLSEANTDLDKIMNTSVLNQDVFHKISELKASINNLAQDNDLQYVKNYYSINIIPQVKKFEDEIEKYQQLVQQYNNLNIDYLIICAELELEPNTYPVTPDSILHMQSEILRLQEIGEKRNYERYIQQSIAEVMQEMGYKVLGKSLDNSANNISHNLYQFSASTAISVTMDANGDVCMELGAMDDQDRDPDTKEAYELKADMEEFCPKHKELKERLAKKGVQLITTHEFPPAVEHAQIFNLNDFDISIEKQKELLKKSCEVKSNRKSNTLYKTID